MNWWQALLAGAGIGLVFIPIFVGIAKLYINLKIKKQIRKAIRNKQFLTPIDKKDYNVEAWKQEIKPPIDNSEVDNLNLKIFKNNVIKEVNND